MSLILFFKLIKIKAGKKHLVSVGRWEAKHVGIVEGFPELSLWISPRLHYKDIGALSWSLH